MAKLDLEQVESNHHLSFDSLAIGCYSSIDYYYSPGYFADYNLDSNHIHNHIHHNFPAIV